MSHITENPRIDQHAGSAAAEAIGPAESEAAAGQLRAQVAKFEKQIHELESGIAGMFGDHDTIQEDRDSTRQLIESVRGDLQRAQRAIARIDAGTFGRCTVCGGSIAAVRLAAIPEAERCSNCA